MYNKVVNIFKGKPDISQINYLSNELNVKALLVTSMDGLWNDTGALKEIYNNEVTSEYYKVYFKE